MSSWGTEFTALLNKMPAPVRALVTAIAAVLLLGMFQTTRKFAIWIGGFVLLIWILKFFKQRA